MIQLTNSQIRLWLDDQDLVPPEPGKLHLLGIRGAIPVSPRQITRVENEGDLYNDSIIAWGSELEAFRGSVDPGKAYSVAPLNPRGCAHLCDGGPYPYARGKHKGHWAVVQAGPLKIWRDRNRDMTQNAGENPEWATGIGLNVHAGGIEVVGKNSAGCLVIQGGYEGLPWRRFMLYIDQAVRSQTGFKLYLLDGPTLNPIIPVSTATEASVREGTAP